MPRRVTKSDSQVRYVLDLVKRLRVMNYSPVDIKIALYKRLGLAVSYEMVRHYIDRVERDIRESALPDREVVKKHEVEVILEIRRQAYEALEKSKQDFQKRLNEVSTNTVGEYQQVRERQQIVTEARNAETRYMAIILESSEQLRSLLGIDEAAKLEVTGKLSPPSQELARINFDEMYEPVPITDPAEAHIKALNASPELIIDTPPERNGQYHE